MSGFCQLLATTDPGRFSEWLPPEALEHIEAIRSGIVAGASPLDLRKAEGGLAEIEFAVRMRPLRHIECHPELKRGDVLGAIGILVRESLLAADDFGALSNACLLLRRLENRIRMMNGRSGGALPDSPEARQDLAKRLRIPGDLLERVDEHKTRAHAVYQSVLHGLLGPPPRLPSSAV